MCQLYGNSLSPPIYVVLPVASFFAGLGSVLIVIALSTTAWEEVKWDSTKLKKEANIFVSESNFYENYGFYIIVTQTNDGNQTSYLRDTYGGVWQLCDNLSDDLRNAYKDADDDAGFLEYKCFNYVTQYNKRKNDGYLDQKAVSLVRMQNSAASCGIVCLMCLGTAALIGILGVWLRQVSMVTVTGVMYIVAAVFLCFSLAIMTTKVGYYQDSTECHSIDSINDRTLCKYRNAKTSWSIPIAWVSFTFLLISFIFWLLLSRAIRLDKIKSAML